MHECLSPKLVIAALALTGAAGAQERGDFAEYEVRFVHADCA